MNSTGYHSINVHGMPATEGVVRRRRLLACHEALKIAAAAATAALLAYVALGMVWGIAIVRGNSMSPAYEDGTMVLFFRLSNTYYTGDVVLIKANGRVDAIAQNTHDTMNDVVKRIVAVPGDNVEIKSGEVWVNGQCLNEPYLNEETYVQSEGAYPLRLNENEYFVLGDNRNYSHDSRNYGPVAAIDIEGKALGDLRVA